VAKPLISVVTPSLNAVETLGQTLTSVREQGYRRIEHIVIDGGSTDGTLELLAQTDGIRYVSEPDRGLSHAVNKGIAMASGDVIGWLNADDFYLPGALDAIAGAFAFDHPPVWATGPCLIVDDQGQEIRRWVTAYKNLFLRHYSYGLHLVQNFISAPSTFVHRACLTDVGGFDERFRYSMDYDLWLRLGRRAPPLVLAHPLAAFRMAGDSLSMQGFEQQFVEHAQNARDHGDGYPLPVALNSLASNLITLTYRMMRRRRTAS
jgi:glycosyltransferase involved in cell wall biosynthesis